VANDSRPHVLNVDGEVAARSVTARLKATEQALRDSEARSRSLFEANPHPMWVYDTASLAFLDVNAAAVAHYGYTRDEFLAMTIGDIHLSEEAPQPIVGPGRIGQPIGASGLSRHRTRDGSIITVEITAHALDSGGKHTAMVWAHDVTERTLAVQVRRNREANWLEAQRIAGIGSWEWTIATGVVSWSEGLNLILARGSDEPALTIESVAAFYTSESWNRLGVAIARTIATGDPYELELEMVRADGTTCWTTTRGEAQRGADGTVVVLRGTIHNIDERRHTEESQQNREAVLREAQRIAGIGNWEWTIANNSVTWSEGLNRITGRGIGLPAPPFETLSSFYTPESWDRLMAEVNTAVDMGAPYELELEMIRADGTSCWTTARGEAVRAPDGAVVQLRGTVHNIDARKRTEGQLRLQSAALNAAAHSMFITDRDGTIAWINPAFTVLTGYSADEAIGRNPRDLIKSGAHNEAFYAAIWATILAGNVWHGELANRRKDGTRYDEDQTITPVKDGQGRITHFISIQRDLTEQRQLETRLLQSQKMEAIGTLAGGIAHDFNNILGAILGFAELATANAAGNETILKDLRHVMEAGQRATDLVRQILTFSRREEPARQQIHLDSIVREVLKLLRASLPASIEFRSTLDPATPAVLADPTQVHQIIMNLGTNAWHAMKDRPGVLEVTLGPVDAAAPFVKAHVGARQGRYALLSIRDTGHGMDEAMQERIFDPFFTTKAPGEGTGLGLATVHGIMKSHGGEISVDSRPDEGTTFHLYFPALEGEVSNADVGPTLVPRGHGQRILFVDDEAGLVAWGARALESLGYSVTGKQDVVEALAAVTDHPEAFDLVVTDLTMPAMTGIDFAQCIWAIRRDLPVILTTGFSATLTVEAVRRLGLGALVLKPTSIKTLGEVVQRVLQAVHS
jgi:PAS domain S-box-containing protein